MAEQRETTKTFQQEKTPARPGIRNSSDPYSSILGFLSLLEGSEIHKLPHEMIEFLSQAIGNDAIVSLILWDNGFNTFSPELRFDPETTDINYIKTDKPDTFEPSAFVDIFGLEPYSPIISDRAFSGVGWCDYE